MSADLKALRHEVADAFTAAEPEWTVYDHPAGLDQVDGPTVLVMPATVPAALGSTPCGDIARVVVVLLAGLPDTDPPALFDALDDMWPAADDVLAKLGAALVAVDAGDYADRFPSRQITCEVFR